MNLQESQKVIFQGKAIQRNWSIINAWRTPSPLAVMSASRPARCIISGSSIPTMRRHICCRNFHTSPTLSERRRPRIASIKAADMGLIANKKPAEELFMPYTDAEKAALAKKYTPAQLRAIEAGEEAVRPQDLDRHGILRSDAGTLPYMDDLSVLKTVVDRKPHYDGPIDPNTRHMTETEMGESFYKTLDRIVAEKPKPAPDHPDYKRKSRPTRVDIERAIQETPGYMGTYGPLPWTPSAVAPKPPKNFSAYGRPGEVKKTADEEREDQRDPDGRYDRLRKQTGLTLDEILDFKVKILVKHNVTNQTRLGKVQSLYVLAIAGNGNGRLGIGQAKGQEAEGTANLAKLAAIRNMQPIPRYEERTIFGEVEGKVSAAEVKLFARPPGDFALITSLTCF